MAHTRNTNRQEQLPAELWQDILEYSTLAAGLSANRLISRFFNDHIHTKTGALIKQLSTLSGDQLYSLATTSYPAPGTNADEQKLAASAETPPKETFPKELQNLNNKLFINKLILRTPLLSEKLTAEQIKILPLNLLPPEQLCLAAENDRDTALFILRTPVLYQNFGRCSNTALVDAHFWAAEQAALNINDVNYHFRGDTGGAYLMRIGRAHREAGAYLLNQAELLRRLSSNDQESLREHIFPRARFDRSHGCCI